MAASRTDSAALLVSIHDVSPLTLAHSQGAVEIALAAGVPVAALTILIIPRHDDRISIDEHPATRDWLVALAASGAHLVMHGYTHRMAGRSLSPSGLLWAHGFARGQGELFNSSAEDAEKRLTAGRQILERAGLASATTGFVPPAWLLSSAARTVVAKSGFRFHEVLAGIVQGDALLARRLVGWGSLNALEAAATCMWAAVQRRRRRVDTRLAIHPADMTRPSTRKSVRHCLDALMKDMHPRSYGDYLQLPR